MVGNGIWDVDSVRARYAGGGDIALAGGEFVTRAPSVNAATMPFLDAINRTGRVPAMAAPAYIPASNDNRELLARIDRLTAEVAALKTEMALNTAVTERGNQVAAAGHAQTAGEISKQTRDLKAEERQTRMNPRAA